MGTIHVTGLTCKKIKTKFLVVKIFGGGKLTVVHVGTYNKACLSVKKIIYKLQRVITKRSLPLKKTSVYCLSPSRYSLIKTLA